MSIASLLRSFGLSLLSIIVVIYITASLSSQSDLALIAYSSWIFSVAVLSLIASYLTYYSEHTSVMNELVLLSVVFLIFAWPSFIFSLPSIEQNYITHIRAEPTLQSYEVFGKVVPLEEHGSFSLHYLVLYILKLIEYGSSMSSSFLVYCNFVIIFSISLSVSIFIWKITGNISAAILMMAFLASTASPAQFERGLPIAMAIFWIILLWSFSNRNRKEDHFLSILIAIALVNSNILVLIFLSIFLILLLGKQFLFRTKRDIRLKREHSWINVLLLSLCLWIAKIIYDTFSFLYFEGYIDGISRMLRGFYSFFSMPFYHPIGGSLHPAVQMTQSVQLTAESLRLTSFLCLVIISLISTFYAFFYIIWRKGEQRAFDFSRSLLLFYLINLGITTLFYIATLSPIGFWDDFGIFLLYMFTPTLLLALAVIAKDLIKGGKEKKTLRWRKTLIQSFLLFVSLTSLLQIAIYPSGGSLTLVEFNSYGQYYYYKKEPVSFMIHVSNNMNVEVLDDSILAQNIELFSKIGSLPPIYVITGYLPSDLKPYVIDQLQTEGNVVYNCAQHQMILRGNKIILYKL